MDISEETGRAFRGMVEEAERLHLEYVTPELLLLHIAAEPAFQEAFENCQGESGRLAEQLEDYVNGLPVLSEEKRKEGAEPEPSADLNELLLTAEWAARSSGRKEVALSHLVSSYFSLKESFALYYLTEQGIEKGEFLLALIEAEEKDGGDEPSAAWLYSAEETGLGGKEEAEKLDEAEDAEDLEDEADAEGPENRRGKGRWKRFAVCLNEEISLANPLIGREKELERTMQILCRKEKNNPLHIGEPGVGKTAVVYGLARLLSEGKVPEPLKGAKIYALDLGGMLAGTQYRGDFEKRLKSVLSGLSQEEKPIVYLDEIHNIVGAGAVGEGSLDASNLLKPYLASGKIRFIGATTHEEYKRYFEKSRSLARRFQNVEIAEPGEDEAAEILLGLKTRYEEYHGVSYQNGVIEYMVHMSAKYINERFLPDKAIDLMDEAGAYRKLHPLAQKRQTVGKDVVDEILAKICRIPRQTVESSETRKLALLEKRLASQVFGQEEAVKEVANAIKFSRAGLLDPGKPLASFLFVGPTGVGKTEIARTLAKELGISLLRFDMSEYEEKHAVAKLIGAPAGYVGYEEGGLLTEAVRKTPHAVLLLDEIEKAHPDIYNILLQVMDYATLTDNQGRKADFRNVILIMTSNAGAGRMAKPGLGFSGSPEEETRNGDEAVLDEVKRVFQPEFRNRLNKIVVFHSIGKKTARAVAGKKLLELGALLASRQVEFSYTRKALDLLAEKGVSREYGARELGRVIDREIKPLLVDRLLFGSLKKGGTCRLDTEQKDGTESVFAVREADGAKAQSRKGGSCEPAEKRRSRKEGSFETLEKGSGDRKKKA